MTLDATAKLLETFEDVRVRLHAAGIGALALDFEIKEDNASGFMGYCYTENDDLIKSGDIELAAKTNAVKHVGIRLRSETDGALYPLPDLIAVLLHEFAHCITPRVYRMKQSDGLSLAKSKKRNRWVAADHGKEFYDNFARILRVAEELGIFTLPKTANKYSMGALKRFDAIDANFVHLPFSSCPIYADVIKSLEEHTKEASSSCSPSGELKSEGVSSGPLRITVVSQRKKKQGQTIAILTDSPRTIKELAAKVRNKFGYKPKTLTDAHGTVLTDAALEAMVNDDKVLVG